MTLRSGFTLGKWQIYPLEGRLISGEDERRVQPKSMDVLLCLAEADGKLVERESLLFTVWGERAQSDEPLTRCIGELRRALGDNRGESEYILTVPKRGYRLLKSVIIGDGGVDSTYGPALTKSQSKTRTGALKKIGVSAVILILAALLFYFVDREVENTGKVAGAPRLSIAVLPLVNISSDKEQEYFSDGISEELSNLLTKIPELHVTSRSSAFSYKDKQMDIPTIAAQLNVAHVLAGSVRKDGDEVRITVQLIDAVADRLLWSQSYDRTLQDIFVTQDEIAAVVVEQLKIKLHADVPKVGITDPDAYALVLRARYLRRQLTPEALEQSIELSQQALAINPDYASAWVGLARSYERQSSQGLKPFDESYALARDAANTALRLDPNNAPAHRVLARIAADYDQDLAAAAQHYERVLLMDPADAESISDAAEMAAALGRLEQAILLLEYAVAMDPVSPVNIANLGIYYRFAGRMDEAIASFQTALILSPEYSSAHYLIGEVLLQQGDAEAALMAMNMDSIEARRLSGLIMVYAALDRWHESDAALATMIDKYEAEFAYNIAYALAFRGEADRMFEWLEKSAAYKDPGLVNIPVESLFAEFRSDPRWLPFLESIGKSPAQLAAIKFDVPLP